MGKVLNIISTFKDNTCGWMQHIDVTYGDVHNRAVIKRLFWRMIGVDVGYNEYIIWLYDCVNWRPLDPSYTIGHSFDVASAM